MLTKILGDLTVLTALIAAIAYLGHEIWTYHPATAEFAYPETARSSEQRAQSQNASKATETNLPRKPRQSIASPWLGNPHLEFTGTDDERGYVNYGNRSFDFDVSIVVFSPTWIPDFPNNKHMAGCADYCTISILPEVSESQRYDADALIFTAQSHDPNRWPPKRKDQLWISLASEPKTFFPNSANRAYNAHFDLFTNLSMHADIPGMTASLNEEVYHRPAPTKKEKSAIGAWFSSNCRPGKTLYRNVYMAQLMKHIRVDSYGDCFHNKDEYFEDFLEDETYPDAIPDYRAAYDEFVRAQPKKKKSVGGKTPIPRESTSAQTGIHSTLRRAQRMYRTASRYLFLFSMESAREDWYVTEKFWLGFRVGAVPVYYGAPQAHLLMPNDSFIDVTQFPSAQKLAERLMYLRDHPAEYAKYFAWKQQPMPPLTREAMRLAALDPDDHTGGSTWACRICEAVAVVKQARLRKKS